jgi:hypothetical protein
MPTPSQPDEIVNFVTPFLMGVGGVAAIANLGSQNNGITRHDGAVDLLLLYRDAQPLNIAQLNAALQNCDDKMKPIVGKLGSAGPWMNGGSHCVIGGQRVDFTYRSVDAITTVIANADEGNADHDWLQHPPFGFSSVAYLGEIDLCTDVFDPKEVLAALKQNVRPYPRTLRSNLVNGFLWGAEFTVASCTSAAQRLDVYTALGGITRSAAMLTFALFALNERYYVSDRGALEVMSTFNLIPSQCHARIHDALRDPDLNGALKQMGTLIAEAKTIVRTMPTIQALR